MRVKCLAQEHNTMTRPGLEPGPLDPESSALTTGPLRLPIYQYSTISQILGFWHSMVLILVFDGVTVKTTNSLFKKYLFLSSRSDEII